MKHTFNPNYKILNTIGGKYTIDMLQKEIGVYSATPEFVRKNCGKIANYILNQIPDWYFQKAVSLGLYPNIDVRIHRLYPGDYPAYPGWHCDGQYRETYFSQPDCSLTKVAHHIICAVSSDEDGIANPQFLDESIEFDVLEKQKDHNLWGILDKKIRDKPNVNKKNTVDGDIIMFDSWSPHRVLPAKKRGWRLFFRLAMWYRENLGKGGMITKQEQVYKILEGGGW